MSVFVDVSYSAYHQMVIDALGMVISNMNTALVFALSLISRSFPYLSLVVPPFIRTMENRQCDQRHITRILYFLMDLVQTVKEHIRTYLPGILKAVEPFWETNQFEILRFVPVHVVPVSHSEFKLYLVYVLPRMLSLLAEDPPEKKAATTEIVHCLHCIVPSLDNHLNVVLPVLIRFIENNQEYSANQRGGCKVSSSNCS